MENEEQAKKFRDTKTFHILGSWHKYYYTSYKQTKLLERIKEK